MRLPPAVLIAISFAASSVPAAAQSAETRTNAEPPRGAEPAGPCAAGTTGGRVPLISTNPECRAALPAETPSVGRRFKGTFRFVDEPVAGGNWRLDGTSTLTPAQPFGAAPSAAPPSADRWRVQQTLTYRARGGVELQAGISASRDSESPFALQQLQAPSLVPLGGFGVEPRSLDTAWHTSFGLRKVLDDGPRTLTLFGEAIDVIPIKRDANDPVAKVSRPPRVRAVGIFGF
jgi:hypothetical protein